MRSLGVIKELFISAEATLLNVAPVRLKTLGTVHVPTEHHHRIDK